MGLFDLFKKKENLKPLTSVERFQIKSRVTGKEYVFYTAVDEDGKWYAMTEPVNYILANPSDRFCIPADDQEDAETKGMAMMNMIVRRDDNV